MHQAHSIAADEPGLTIAAAVAECLVVEEDRGLLPRALLELRRHLADLADHFAARQQTLVAALSLRPTIG